MFVSITLWQVTVKNVFVIESFIQEIPFQNVDLSSNETSEMGCLWVSHWIIHSKLFFIILKVKNCLLYIYLLFKYVHTYTVIYTTYIWTQAHYLLF